MEFTRGLYAPREDGVTPRRFGALVARLAEGRGGKCTLHRRAREKNDEGVYARLIMFITLKLAGSSLAVSKLFKRFASGIFLLLKIVYTRVYFPETANATIAAFELL